MVSPHPSLLPLDEVTEQRPAIRAAMPEEAGDPSDLESMAASAIADFGVAASVWARLGSALPAATASRALAPVPQA